MNHPLWTVKNVCGHQLLDEKVTDWLAVFGHFCWQKKLERKNTRRKKKTKRGEQVNITDEGWEHNFLSVAGDGC